VASDPQLTALAHLGNRVGFQQFSFLLAAPAPFLDTPLHADTPLKFISDSNDLAACAEALAGHEARGDF
jgi:hypothetical protein